MIKIEQKQKTGNWVYVEGLGYGGSAKIYPKPSEFGIHNGRVSKLSLRNKDGQIVFNYDRGHDVNRIDTETLNEIVEALETFAQNDLEI